MSYTPTGTYSDQYISAQDKAKIDAQKAAYAAAQAAGDTAGMQNAHSAAEAVRAAYKYSGGTDGSEYNPLQFVGTGNNAINAPAKSAVQAATPQTSYLDALYKAQQEASLGKLKSAYDQNVITLDAQAAKIPQTYQTARNTTAATAEQNRAGFNERATAYGLNSGAGGQADLAMRNQNAANMSQINTAQANAVTDLDTQRLQIKTQYENQIAQAIANGEMAKAEALYNDAVRVDNSLIQQSAAQAQLDYQNWAQTNALMEEKAKMLASVGDFSGFAALGYTPEQIASMQAAYQQANFSSANFSSGGGGGGTPTYTPEDDGGPLFGNVKLSDADADYQVGMNRSKTGQAATVARLYDAGQITEAQAEALYKKHGLT